MFLRRITLLACLIQGIHLCGIHICLTWSVTTNAMQLFCKVSNLNHKVKMFNPNGIEVGYCLVPTPAEFCYVYTQSINLTQSTETNVTTLTLHGEMTSSINGKWSCHHGTNIDVATVNVTILKDQVTDVYVDKSYECFAWTAIPFVFFFPMSLFIFMCGTRICKKKTGTKENNRNWKAKLKRLLQNATGSFGEKWKPFILCFIKGGILVTLLLVLCIVPLSMTRNHGNECPSSTKYALLCYGLFTGFVTGLLLYSPGTLSSRQITSDANSGFQAVNVHDSQEINRPEGEEKEDDL